MSILNTPKPFRPRHHHRPYTGLTSWVAMLVLAGWASASWAGTLVCARNGAVVSPQGTLKIGDSLSCSNQASGGGDVDSFTVRRASTCPSTSSQVIALGTGQTDPVSERQIQVTFTGFIANKTDLELGTTGDVSLCANTTASYSAVWDTDPPPPISLVRTTVDLVNGVATIAGGAGSVEAGATVSLRNNRAGTSQTRMAASDGGVTLSITAQEGDKLAITVTDRNLNTSTIPNAQGHPVTLETVVTALADPAAKGALPVGVLVLDDPNGLSGVTDPAWFQTRAEDPNPTLAWAKIMYPATRNGVGTPAHSSGSWPVVLLLHGRHFNCDPDGSFSSNLNTQCDSYPTLCLRAKCTYDFQRIPSHEGHDYLMEKLASLGFFVISVSAHELQLYDEQWNFAARGRLVLRFLDKLRDWTQMGSDPFGGRFAGKLDMSRIGLVGHSRGGEGVVAAQSLNPNWPPESKTPAPHSIKAIVAIAPTDGNPIERPYDVKDSSYLLVLGSRDGDVGRTGFRVYDRAYPETTLGCVSIAGRLPKAIAYAYSANHNYFNTIWTDERDSEYWATSPNLWVGAKDDSTSTPKLSAAAQRRVALTAIVPFLRWQLRGEENYREVLTGEHRFAQGPSEVFWTFQDGWRKTVDDFEQLPAYNTSTNPILTSNALGGAQTLGDFSFLSEGLFFTGDLNVPLQRFSPTTWEATWGPDHSKWLVTTWESGKQGRIESYLPPCHADLSAYRYLSLRAAKLRCIASGCTGNELPINLLVNIVDTSGRSASVDLRADLYAVLPASRESAQLSSVRIPLSHFTANGSQVDLRNISRIRIRTDRDFDAMALDDIEFGN